MHLNQFLQACEVYVQIQEDTSEFRELVSSSINTVPTTRTTMAGVGTFRVSRCIFCDAEGENSHRWKDCQVVKDPYERIKVFRMQKRWPHGRWL